MKKKITIFCLLFSIILYSQESTINKINVSKNVFIDVSGGLGLRLGKTIDTENTIEDQYLRSLRSGINYDVSLFFRLKDNSPYFIGFKHNAFHKKSTIANVLITAPNGVEDYGTLEDNISISYYGVSYLYSKQSQDKSGEFNFDIGLGYIAFKDKAIVIQKYKIVGGSLGVYSSIGYLFNASKSVSIGPKFGILFGSMSSIDISGPNNFKENLELENIESLSRIDLSIQTRIKF